MAGAATREDRTTRGHTTAAEGDRLLGPLLPALRPWLVTRRWFSQESGCLQDIRPVSTAVLPGGGAVLLHAVVVVRHTSSAARRYQLLLGLRRELPARLAAAAIGQAVGGEWDGWWLYEATEDPESMSRLLDSAAHEASSPLQLVRCLDTPVRADLAARQLRVEQSNTSVVYGDRLLLKLLRRPEDGPHPEVAVLRALTEVRSTRTPRLVGWLRLADGPGGGGADGSGGAESVLGVLTEFLAAEGTGWELAVRQAGDFLEARHPAAPAVDGFHVEARALGAAVAELHSALAEAFPTVRLEPGEVLRQTAELARSLRSAVREVPRLEAYAGRIAGLYEDYEKVALRGNLTAQRLHGDLHLGQVLRTAEGWKVIDFEGEPLRPVAERGLPQPALRDVAGMLRSFDYAARQAFAARPPGGELPQEPSAAPERRRRARRAQAWAVRNRRAFTAGYTAAGGADPHCHPVVLHAFEAEKAVYEAVYEARHRPDWLPIPLAALQRLVSGR
ncbi:maltokinase N-terminal cap-like domain-containing protein [Kitasatospora sp. NPDC001175]|uniref:maltokinase N-terminal cap-like domain-containing protein n=1 Tax=Kitasatospora sp. NPDC001175 TaxID=3157103 RepID=UPI003D0512CE